MACFLPGAAMPLYYFDTWDGDKVVSDNEGAQCANDQAACAAAAKALLELARDVVNGTTSCELSVEVSDAAKKPVCRATLQFEIEQLNQLQ
jgi:hypothetical protein